MPQNDRDRPADISLKALLVAGSLSVLALWWAWPRLHGSQSFHAESSPLMRIEPRPLPAFHLEGVQGPLHAESLKGQWTLLYFAYSRCPDDCPTTLGALASLRRSMVAARQLHGLRFVIVSVAADDDPQRIQDFVGSFDSSFEAYTGTWEEREKLSLFFDAEVDVAFERGPDQYFHSSSVFLINPEAYFVASWNRLPNRALMKSEICSFINCTH